MASLGKKLDHWTIGPLDHWTIGPLDHWTIGPLDHWTIGPRPDSSSGQDYKKVPIAVFSDGTVVGDSTKIVDKVAGSEV